MLQKDTLEYVVKLRREIHEYPEIGFDLPKTLAVVRRELDAMGIPYTEEYGPSSIVATINPACKGFTIGIRGDMDALPMQEETGLPFASKIPGQMHACGHDGHMANLLVFAQWLTQGQNEDGVYNLTTWCKAGHVPAWKNVYESDSYKAAEEKSITLQAMGDPEQIIALESSKYATTLISGLTTAVGNVSQQLLSEDGCTVDAAKKTMEDIAASTQEALNLLNLGIK